MPAVSTIDLVKVCHDVLDTTDVYRIVIVWLPANAIEPITRTVTSRQDLAREVDLLRGIIDGVVCVSVLVRLSTPLSADQFDDARPWPQIPGGWHRSLVANVGTDQTGQMGACFAAFQYS